MGSVKQLNLFSAPEPEKEPFDPLRPWYPIWEDYVLKIGRLYQFDTVSAVPHTYGKQWKKWIDEGWKRPGDSGYVYMSLCRLLKLDGETCEVESVSPQDCLSGISGCVFKLNVRGLWPNHYRKKAYE